jgi:hypothetical protein
MAAEEKAEEELERAPETTIQEEYRRARGA